MDSIKTDVLVVGAGAVGLAVAERLSQGGSEVVVVERHDGFGRETSSRNSEVIHAGIYYREGSLKARLCIEGRRMLYELCEAHSIPFRRIGKLVVADTDEELEAINMLIERGRRNGCEELSMLGSAGAAAVEPELRCRGAIFSPDTGIFDSHAYMQTLERLASERGAVFAYGCTAQGSTLSGGGWTTLVVDSDGQEIRVDSAVVVNAAGLGADRFAAGCGIDIDLAGYRQDPCKGEYFRVSDRLRGTVSHLIYPPPTGRLAGEPAENVHLVVGLDASMKIGPNKVFDVPPDDYTVDASKGPFFAEEMRRFLPFLRDEDLRPDTAGVRAMRAGERDGFKDFIIQEESDRGKPGLITLIGIQSPGLTSSQAIAETVSRLL